MHVTTQCRVDAPIDWVRSFLVAGAADDQVSVEGDVVEVRQSAPLIHLVVRNALSVDDDGLTLLDIDARLRLHGLGLIVGSIFRRRLRRTLVRSLDALPTAIEYALEQADRDQSAEADPVTHGAGTETPSGPSPAG